MSFLTINTSANLLGRLQLTHQVLLRLLVVHLRRPLISPDSYLVVKFPFVFFLSNNTRPNVFCRVLRLRVLNWRRLYNLSPLLGLTDSAWTRIRYWIVRDLSPIGLAGALSFGGWDQWRFFLEVGQFSCIFFIVIFFFLKASILLGGLFVEEALELALKFLGVHGVWIHGVFKFQLNIHESFIVNKILFNKLYSLSETNIREENVLTDKRHHVGDRGELCITRSGQLIDLDLHDSIVEQDCKVLWNELFSLLFAVQP